MVTKLQNEMDLANQRIRDLQDELSTKNEELKNLSEMVEKDHLLISSSSLAEELNSVTIKQQLEEVIVYLESKLEMYEKSKKEKYILLNSIE